MLLKLEKENVRNHKHELNCWIVKVMTAETRQRALPINGADGTCTELSDAEND
jgi:hypothetical protein